MATFKIAPTLYHYTCGDHGLPGIASSRTLLPRKHPLMPSLGAVVWLTSLPYLTDADEIGINPNEYSKLTCNRTEYRITVRSRAVVPWSDIRHKVKPTILAALEEYADPSTWWIARRPLTNSELELPV